MKKKLIGVAVIAAIAVTAGWNFNQNKNEIGMSDLALANVEALADPETDWGMCTFYGCKAYFGYTCTVYDRVWDSLIKTCPDMRG